LRRDACKAERRTWAPSSRHPGPRSARGQSWPGRSSPARCAAPAQLDGPNRTAAPRTAARQDTGCARLLSLHVRPKQALRLARARSLRTLALERARCKPAHSSRAREPAGLCARLSEHVDGSRRCERGLVRVCQRGEHRAPVRRVPGSRVQRTHDARLRPAPGQHARCGVRRAAARARPHPGCQSISLSAPYRPPSGHAKVIYIHAMHVIIHARLDEKPTRLGFPPN